MIASLKLGCLYVMLDPDSPVERLRKILVTCHPTVLVAESDFIKPVGKSHFRAWDRHCRSTYHWPTP